jgi:hypothetical protein
MSPDKPDISKRNGGPKMEPISLAAAIAALAASPRLQQVILDYITLFASLALLIIMVIRAAPSDLPDLARIISQAWRRP